MHCTRFAIIASGTGGGSFRERLIGESKEAGLLSVQEADQRRVVEEAGPAHYFTTRTGKSIAWVAAASEEAVDFEHRHRVLPHHPSPHLASSSASLLSIYSFTLNKHSPHPPNLLPSRRPKHPTPTSAPLHPTPRSHPQQTSSSPVPLDPLRHSTPSPGPWTY